MSRPIFSAGGKFRPVTPAKMENIYGMHKLVGLQLF